MACNCPITIPSTNKYLSQGTITVPCGRCYGCLSMKRTQWTFRFEQEFKYSTKTFFVTLTYDNENVPWIEGNYGKFFCSMCFNKDDYQKWLKRIRKNTPDSRFKYYAVGEYGTDTARPHYHFLIFATGHNMEKLEEQLSKQWTKGNVKVDELLNDNHYRGALHYVTKHQLKLEGDAKYWKKLVNNDKEALRKLQPFAAMSKGIGKCWLTEDIYNTYSEEYRTYIIFDGQPMSMPRYYKQKLYGFFTKQQKAAYAKKAMAQYENRYNQTVENLIANNPDLNRWNVHEHIRINNILESDIRFSKAKKKPRNANSILHRQQQFAQQLKLKDKWHKQTFSRTYSSPTYPIVRLT